MTLQVGDKAPNFKLPADDGKTLSSDQFRGKKLVLYFYPKDDTPGCTKEAIGFSDAQREFLLTDTRVIGVSRDSSAKHQKFKEKYDLEIILLSDETGELCKHYNVWQKKKNYGKEHMGIERSTFLIDASGVIKKIWRKVRVPGHVDEVLEEVKKL